MDMLSRIEASVDRENARKAKKKEKKEWKTKQIYVRASDVVEDLRTRDDVVYPIYFSILYTYSEENSTAGGVMRVLKNADDFDSIRARELDKQNLIRISVHEQGTYVDTIMGGRFTVPKNYLDIGHLRGLSVYDVHDFITDCLNMKFFNV